MQMERVSRITVIGDCELDDGTIRKNCGVGVLAVDSRIVYLICWSIESSVQSGNFLSNIVYAVDVTSPLTILIGTGIYSHVKFQGGRTEFWFLVVRHKD